MGASPVTLEALFIPKLQRYFAEFLNHSSPTRLGLLDLSTCVGFGYGRQKNSLEAFLGSLESVTSSERLGITSQAHEVRIYLALALHASPRTTNAWDHLSSCVTPLLAASSWVDSLSEESSLLATTIWLGRASVGTGISTSCASTTPFGLALAPD